MTMNALGSGREDMGIDIQQGTMMRCGSDRRLVSMLPGPKEPQSNVLIAVSLRYVSPSPLLREIECNTRGGWRDDAREFR